jgi:hypothetical protein
VESLPLVSLFPVYVKLRVRPSPSETAVGPLNPPVTVRELLLRSSIRVRTPEAAKDQMGFSSGWRNRKSLPATANW